jgi:hypothetical protein
MKIRKNSKYLSIITIICFVVFLPFFLNPSFLINIPGDLKETYFPLIEFFKKSIKTYHEIPLWRPSIFSGMPLLGDLNSAIFYLPNYLFLVLPTDFCFIFLLFLHFLFASISMYFLARSYFKISKQASLLAALYYLLFPKNFAHLKAGHVVLIFCLAWAPLIFLLAIKLTKKPLVKTSLLLSISLAFSYFAHYITYYILGFLTWLLIVKSLFLKNKKRIIKIWSHFFLTLALFLGLVSIQLLPFLEIAQKSTRSLLGFKEAAIPPWSLKRFFFSTLFPWGKIDLINQEAFLYLGIIPVALSFFGILILKKKQKIFFLASILLVILYSFGSRLPFYKFFYTLVPGIKWMRVTTRPWFIVQILIALLIGLGFDFLKKNKKSKAFLLLIIFTSIVLELSTVDFLRFKNNQPLLDKTDQILRFLKEDSDSFRVYCTTHCLSQKTAQQYGIRLVDGESPLQLKDYLSFQQKAGGYQWSEYAVIHPPYQVFNEKPQPDAYLLGLLNTKYVLSPYEITAKNFLLVKKSNDMLIYQNQKFLPSAYLINDSETIPIKITSHSPNKIILDTQNLPSGKLVLSEIFYLGWKATSDGQVLKIFPHEKILRAVSLKDSDSKITFSYEPLSFKIGLFLSSVTLLGIIILWRRK